jgi:phage terminase Nu1 subunit (DNA packaging protein)
MEKQKFRRSLADLVGDPPPARRSHNGGKGDGGRSANPYRDELYQEQARTARLKADLLEGRLVPAADVLAQWTARITETRHRLLAVHSRVGSKCNLTKAQVADLDREIRAALAALAGHGSDSNVDDSP